MSGLNFEGTSVNTILHNQNTVSDYFRIIRINIWRILSFTAISGILGYFIAQSIVPSYKADTRLIIERETQSKTLGSLDVLDVAKNPAFLPTQVESIKSRKLLGRVVRQFKLDKHPAYNKPRRSGIVGFIVGAFGLDGKNGTSTSTLVDENSVLSRFEKDLTVTSNTRSGVIVVSFESIDKNIVAKIANQISTTYLHDLAQSKLDHSQKSVSWLTSKMEEARDKLVKSEAKLKIFQDAEKIGDSEQEKVSRSKK